jgi:hypothetical protein
MKLHHYIAAVAVALQLPAVQCTAELYTYQFVVGDRPFRLYSEDGTTGLAKLAGSFDLEFRPQSSIARIARIDAFFFDPLWNRGTVLYPIPPYLVGELNFQPWSDVWPNDLTRLNVTIVSESELRVYGPGASWSEFHFPVMEDPHSYYFTDLTIVLDGNNAVLNGTARFRGDDGTDYDLTNALALRVVPEPASAWSVSLLLSISLSSLRPIRSRPITKVAAT